MCAQKTEIIVMMRALQLATGKTVISMLILDATSLCFLQSEPSGNDNNKLNMIKKFSGFSKLQKCLKL